jgi:hypothetical protein
VISTLERNGTRSDSSGGATSPFETGLKALLRMRAQTTEPHAEEARSAVSKYEVAP